MHAGRTVFAQLMDLLPNHEFNKCVVFHGGSCGIRSFSCFDQFLCMAFAQLTGCDSLRDIEIRLSAAQPKLYHSGFRSPVARSTLADANERRTWLIYRDVAQTLIRIARPLYANDPLVAEIEQTVYALDSTTIELCRSLFPWAHYQRNRSAVKLHTLLDLRGNIPCWIYISDGKTYDTDALDELMPESGAWYVLDRGYVDFARLANLTESLSYFVVRARDNLNFVRSGYQPVDHSTGLRSDQRVRLRIARSAKRYPYPLRYIGYYDDQRQRRLNFLSNNFKAAALTITQLYRYRWQVELFFKWIKQHLRIKAFFGTSQNAVGSQVWIGISVYLLLAILKKRLQSDRSLYEIQQIISISLFEQMPISQALTRNTQQFAQSEYCNQLKLFDL